ncbi:hypothetical protein AVEN_64132-1 [Araneus ventricosus]|uniref:Uncharacterized protein n=1 Tax=Araneus ventricosus TaxID=182803 RepID=A0A4Y2C4Q6_ARAVE|nr:hypothetical protein AVEN_64132-1 [Araneus ventricosus]
MEVDLSTKQQRLIRSTTSRASIRRQKAVVEEEIMVSYKPAPSPPKGNVEGSKVLPLVWYGSLERGFQLKRRPRHLATVHNYEVRPEIPLVLLQNGALI